MAGRPRVGDDRLMSQSLAAGLVLRAARPGDLGQIGALLAERGDPADPVDHRLVVEDPDAGWECCAVVVDGDRVVSTLTLLDETVYLDGVAIRAGQVELVATDREYEGRGLVRALMDWAHRRSAARGHLVQVLIGIPYFYRQFGYQYAIPIPRGRPITHVPPVDGYVVREARPDEIAVQAALQNGVQRTFDVRMPHSAACWRWLTARQGSVQLLVERDSVPVGTARITPPDEDDALIGEIAAVEPAAVQALLGYAQAERKNVTVAERPGRFAALEPFVGPAPRQASAYYVRVADPAALLDHLRPVLSQRLPTSADGEIVVSFFRSHVRMPHTGGTITAVRSGGPMQAPGQVGGAGVAPDLVGGLLFGPHGIEGLAERHPDVYPGPNAELMAALFPPVSADLLTYYLP